MRKIWIGMLTGLILVGAAAAHHPTESFVKERRDSIEAMQVAAKVLGRMAQGKAAFDAEEAGRALARLAKAGRLVPELFAVQDISGPSEALPAIWENWADFLAKSDALVLAADVAPTDLARLQVGFGAVERACVACHETYRKSQ